MKRKNNEEDYSCDRYLSSLVDSKNDLEKSLLERQPLSGNSILEMRGERLWGIPISRSSRREEKPNRFGPPSFRGNFFELNRVTSDSFREQICTSLVVIWPRLAYKSTNGCLRFLELKSSSI